MTAYDIKKLVNEAADLVARGMVDRAVTAVEAELIGKYQEGYFAGRESYEREGR